MWWKLLVMMTMITVAVFVAGLVVSDEKPSARRLRSSANFLALTTLGTLLVLHVRKLV
jgi:hypothetical protein